MRPPSRKGSKLSFLSRDKISEALRKRIRKPMSMEQKEKISKKLKDKPKKERSVEHRKNIGLSKAKSYIIIFPDGKQEEIFNMTDFCRKYNLSQPHLHSTSKGKRKHHKGFSAILKSQEI
jgi:hypothetical protein